MARLSATREVGVSALTDLLVDLVTPDEAMPLLDAAASYRELAALAQEARQAALAQTAEQAAAGIWRSPALTAALTAARREPLLLNMSRERYIAAHDGAHDLDNEYYPLLPPGEAITADDLAAALSFIEKARDPQSAELWFAALQAEGLAYLHQLRADGYLAEALASLDALEALLLSRLDATDPYAEHNIRTHAAILALYFEHQLAWRVEAAYRRFLAAFPADPFPELEARARAAPEYREAIRLAYTTLVVDAWNALLMRNPSDRTEVERLERLLEPGAFVPALAMFEPDVIALPDLPPAEFAAAAEALTHIGAGLGQAAARARTVLRAWAAVARRGLLNFRGVAAALPVDPAAPDDEALGIVVQALRGETRYRMGRYEDAYIDLLRAEAAARRAARRRAALRAAAGAEGALDLDREPDDLLPAERDALARLAQKAGNALAAIGDEDAARAAYERAAGLAVDPLSRAGDQVNQGNLHFLHNSVVGGQGYITLDASARQAFVLRGPQELIATVVGRHVESLCAAEQCYRAALAALAEVDGPAQGAKLLAAACHINLGNVAWAWAKTLTTEAASRLGDLPLGAAFASQLVSPDADAPACYAAAIAAYEAALDLLSAGSADTPSDGSGLSATALSSLSEMRFLLARELARPSQSGAGWPAPPDYASPAYRTAQQGLADARACLDLLGIDASALHPDLAWRTHYNQARLHRLLGHRAAAGAGFRRAIRLVEQLRGQLRLDAFQVAFLHDKHDVYEGYIDFLLAQQASGAQAQAGAHAAHACVAGPHAARIFAAFERSRAHAFRMLLQAAHAPARLPPDLEARSEDLLAQVSACNEAVQAAVAADDRAETERLLAEQTRLARAWADLQAEVAQAQRRRRAAGAASGRLARFQAALAADQSFLGVLLGDEASYALLIDRDAARVFRLPPRRTLELLALPVLTYATWSNAETAPAFRAANTRLVDALLGPLDDAMGLKQYLAPEGAPRRRLLISPDGLLCYLPFDALLADRAGVQALAEAADYPDFVPFYLLSLADLSYVPSAAAWLALARRKPRTSRAGLLAVYNVHYDTPEPPLWAVSENILLKLGAVTSPPDMARITAAVKKAWPDLDTVYLRSRKDDGAAEDPQRQSTEANFLKLAPAARARVLMFHGHGIYNDRYPSLSGLIFNLAAPAAPASADAAAATGERAAIPTAGDGFLRVEELFKLALPGVELTLLAACQTALGAYRRGEGLGALVRAFLYRGSPAVAATLWEVRADMTAFLLRVFFRLLSEQPQADRARLFCEAKRKAIPYVANLCLPYFWAPYVLWGHTGGPED